MHKLEISISQGEARIACEKSPVISVNTGNAKKAIASRCKAWGYSCTFDDYFGEHNIQVN